MSRTRPRRAFISSLVVASLLILSLGSGVCAQTLRTTPAAAPTDYELLWHDGCFAFAPAVRPQQHCVFGDLTSHYKVVIVGDSHTSDFFPAFNKIAKARHWRLYTYVKADCPFIDLPIRNAADMSRYPECAQWNKYVLGRLQRLKPDLTIILDVPADRGRGFGAFDHAVQSDRHRRRHRPHAGADLGREGRDRGYAVLGSQCSQLCRPSRSGVLRDSTQPGALRWHQRSRA